jgi:PQQ-like domain
MAILFTVVAVVALLMIAGAAVGFLTVRRTTVTPMPVPPVTVAPTATARPKPTPAVPTLGWEGVHGVLFADANGDGVPDVIGRTRYVLGGDRITLVAFEASTGRTIWESGTLGTYTQTYQGTLGLSQDVLVLCRATGETSGWGLRDGKVRWTGSLPEKTKSLCKGDRPGEVVAQLADGTSATIRLADGHATAPTPGARPCVRLPGDAKDADPGFEFQDSMSSSVPGMTVTAALVRPGSPRILLGSRAVGTNVPMIAAVFPDASRNWKSELPSTDRLEAQASFPVAGGLTSTRACTTYTLSGASRTMAVCFDLAGHRLWESPVAPHDPVSAVQSDDRRVYVSQWNQLNVFDAVTGAPAYTVGR